MISHFVEPLIIKIIDYFAHGTTIIRISVCAFLLALLGASAFLGIWLMTNSAGFRRLFLRKTIVDYTKCTEAVPIIKRRVSTCKYSNFASSLERAPIPDGNNRQTMMRANVDKEPLNQSCNQDQGKNEQNNI